MYGGKEEPDLCDNIDNSTIMIEVKKRDEHKAPKVDMLSTKEVEYIISGGEGHLVILVMNGERTIVERYYLGIKK